MAVNIKKLESYFLECISDEVNYVNDWVNSGWVGTFNLDMVLSFRYSYSRRSRGKIYSFRGYSNTSRVRDT